MNHISYQELQNWQAENKPFQLIDVREEREHIDFNIGGELIPLNELIRQPQKVNSELPVVVYCKRGIRSQLAIQRLGHKLPKVRFYNLRDGIYALKYKVAK